MQSTDMVSDRKTLQILNKIQSLSRTKKKKKIFEYTATNKFKKFLNLSNVHSSNLITRLGRLRKSISI